jgi:hypothetical protein
MRILDRVVNYFLKGFSRWSVATALHTQTRFVVFGDCIGIVFGEADPPLPPSAENNLLRLSRTLVLVRSIIESGDQNR